MLAVFARLGLERLLLCDFWMLRRRWITSWEMGYVVCGHYGRKIYIFFCVDGHRGYGDENLSRYYHGIVKSKRGCINSPTHCQ